MKNLYHFVKNKLNIDNFIINKILFNKNTNNFEIEIIKTDNKTLKSENLTISFNEINNLDLLLEVTQYFKEHNINNNFLNLINKINYQLRIFSFFIIFIIFLLIVLIFNTLNNSNINELINIFNTKPKYVYRVDDFEDYEFEKKINELGKDGWELVFARRALKNIGYKFNEVLKIEKDYEAVYECIFRKKIN